ncbi:MAG TPA: hypothetical protein VMS64_01955 [Candidatus Methylomirabilis sp.]|nr:hypothetical protein [Candidatus Methylomirabilis sp.]
MARDADAIGIGHRRQIPPREIENAVEEQAHVGNAIGDPALNARGPLLRAVALRSTQLWRDRLRVIQRPDDVTMAAQVRAKKCRLSPVAAAAVGKDDQWISPGKRRSVAALTRSSMLRGCGIPDLARESPIPRGLERFDRAHANRKSTPPE